MSNLTTKFYDLTKTKKTKHFIETGTYLGYGIKRVLENYEYIHSIELSEKWYNYNKEQFKMNDNVKLYLGDSKKVLQELLNTINEPVTIYLDAHYSGTPTACGEEETPLLYELEILKNRQYDDIIIIDDTRMIGKKGTSGSVENTIYPLMDYDWTDITDNKIYELMKDGYIMLKNDNSVFTDQQPDQYILVKTSEQNINIPKRPIYLYKFRYT